MSISACRSPVSVARRNASSASRVSPAETAPRGRVASSLHVSAPKLRWGLLLGALGAVLAACDDPFDDLLVVRVRAEPGSLPVEEPPDEVAHLVHDIDAAVTTRLSGAVGDARTDGR